MIKGAAIESDVLSECREKKGLLVGRGLGFARHGSGDTVISSSLDFSLRERLAL